MTQRNINKLGTNSKYCKNLNQLLMIKFTLVQPASFFCAISCCGSQSTPSADLLYSSWHFHRSLGGFCRCEERLEADLKPNLPSGG